MLALFHSRCCCRSSSRGAACIPISIQAIWYPTGSNAQAVWSIGTWKDRDFWESDRNCMNQFNTVSLQSFFHLKPFDYLVQCSLRLLLVSCCYMSFLVFFVVTEHLEISTYWKNIFRSPTLLFLLKEFCISLTAKDSIIRPP